MVDIVVMQTFRWSLLLILAISQNLFASENKLNTSDVYKDLDYQLSTERLNGIPMDVMRYNDALLFRSAYGAGGDLFSQFVRFLFPISGREKRTMFMPLSYWDTKKPRYVTLKWDRFESDHFDFYAYPESQKTLNSVIKYYEEEYDRNNRIFGVDSKFSKKIPVIFYQTRRDFEQTAIVDGPIPEGLGGLTEILSWRRVTFPFEGEWYKLEHVAKHEGTHVFQIAKNAKKLPLWFIEGSAETNSIYWDSDAEMLARDAFLNGFFYRIQDLWQIEGTWLMYKIGNFICNVIWDEYGEEGFKKIYENASKKPFEANIEDSLGIDMQELDRKVQATLLKKYSYLLNRDDIQKTSKKIDERKIILASYDRFFVSGGLEGPRNAIYMNYLGADGERASKKISEDKTFTNESFETFDKGVFLTDSLVVYSVKKSAIDELRIIPYKFDVKKKKFTFEEEKAYSWKEIERIQHPVFLKDKRVAFIGYQDGFSNLFIASLVDGSFEKLTQGQEHYSDLDYSSIRDEIIFSKECDRDPKRIYYNRDLFSMDLKTKKIKQLTDTKQILEIQPRYSPDGKKVIYVATPNFTYDLMYLDLESGNSYQLTAMNVGAKNPQWSPNDSILWNGNKGGSPTIYQFTIPNFKDLAKTKLPTTPALKFSLQDGKVTLPSVAAEPKKPDELVLDGFYEVSKKPVVRFKSRNYTAQSISTLEQKLILKTQEGLPADKQTKHEILPHYFEMEGSQIKSLKSAMVADDGISEDIQKWAELKLQGRDIVQSWMSQDHTKALLIVNNRLAKDYESFKTKPEVSLLVYDGTTNHMEELEKGPIKKLADNVQWVAFLKNDQIFVAMGAERTGLFEGYIYNQKTKAYTLLAHEIQQFRVSSDSGKILWKSTGLYLADFSQPTPFTITKFDKLPEKVMSFEFNQADNPVFFSFQAKNKKWAYTVYNLEQKKFESKELQRKDDEIVYKTVISTGGYVAVSLSTKEKKKFAKMWIWNTNNDELTQLKTLEEDFSQLVFRKNYLTFIGDFHDSRPAQEYLWSPELKDELKPFDLIQTSNLLDNQFVYEGKKNLSVYDRKQNLSNTVDNQTIGYTVDGNRVVYSSRIDEHFQISEYDLNAKTKKQVTHSPYDKSSPSIRNQELAYVVMKDGSWDIETQKASGVVQTISSPEYHFTNLQKDQNELKVQAQSKEKNIPLGPEHVYQPEYQTMLQPQPVRNRLRLQNLAAAAAYDGDAVRYFLSAYADNLFSDRGIFVNSMFLGDTKFATVGYSNLNTGNNVSFFYNVRDGIENYGLDFSKNYIFDRYRQLTPYFDVEYQAYTPDSSALNSFITSEFDSKSFYLMKVGAIYSYDVTIWDRHGPASGSRLYFRTETGLDASNGRSSNTDFNIDIRVYNSILPRFGLAHRLAGGTSQGAIPNIYLVGGNMSFRGVGFDDLIGQNYWVFSEDIRLPVFDFIGAKFFDPADMVFGYFTRYFDVRAGVYGDFGSTWMNGDESDFIYSIGYFVNIPTAFGLIVRLNQGFIGEKKFGLWFGTNW